MSESSGKLSPAYRSRVYENASRTSYFNLGSRKTLMRGLSRLSAPLTTSSNSVAGENDDACQNILCKRGFFKRVFYNKFNNIFNKKTINNNNNCKKYGIVLMLLFVVNLALMILVYSVKNPLVCRKELTGYNVRMEHVLTFEPKDCGISGKSIDFDKIYVYYEIHNYPFHYSNVYKLHSKVQLSGKVTRNREDLEHCGRYTKVLINGVNRVMNPCGSHAVNVYNDQFNFLDPEKEKDWFSVPKEDRNKPEREEILLELDESRETLVRHQEYRSVKNVSKEDKLTFSDYYWLADIVEYAKELNVGLNKNFELINGWNLGNEISAQLNSDKAGEAAKNGHFIQWLTAPPFPDFSKLYGVLKGPVALPLTVKFNNNYDVGLFGGKKFLVLRASSLNFGNLNVLRVLFTLFTPLSLVFSLVFLLCKPKHNRHLLNLL